MEKRLGGTDGNRTTLMVKRRGTRTNKGEKRSYGEACTKVLLVGTTLSVQDCQVRPQRTKRKGPVRRKKEHGR